MLELSLATCGTLPGVASVVLVARTGEGAQARRIAAHVGLEVPLAMATGGSTRLESELAGLDAIRDEVVRGDIDIIVIHDGARPFATADLFSAVIDEARRVGGAVPAVAVREPTYHVAGGRGTRLEPGAVVAVQTPQAFRSGALLSAYDRARDAGFDAVDTAQTVERFGDLDIAAVPGDERNVKITFAPDLAHARSLASSWAVGRWT